MILRSFGDLFFQSCRAERESSSTIEKNKRRGERISCFLLHGHGHVECVWLVCVCAPFHATFTAALCAFNAYELQ